MHDPQQWNRVHSALPTTVVGMAPWRGGCLGGPPRDRLDGQRRELRNRFPDMAEVRDQSERHFLASARGAGQVAAWKASMTSADAAAGRHVVTVAARPVPGWPRSARGRWPPAAARTAPTGRRRPPTGDPPDPLLQVVCAALSHSWRKIDLVSDTIDGKFDSFIGGTLTVKIVDQCDGNLFAISVPDPFYLTGYTLRRTPRNSRNHPNVDCIPMLAHRVRIFQQRAFRQADGTYRERRQSGNKTVSLIDKPVKAINKPVDTHSGSGGGWHPVPIAAREIVVQHHRLVIAGGSRHGLRKTAPLHHRRRARNIGVVRIPRT